jgi:hypothetical protein
MSNYTYKDPLKIGYKQFKLTKKQHNKLFKYRQIKWQDKYEYYYNDKEVILHKFYNWKVIVLQIVFLPIIILLNGLINIKETWKDTIKLFKQKETGYFIGDSAYSGTYLYNKIIDIIHKN